MKWTGKENLIERQATLAQFARENCGQSSYIYNPNTPDPTREVWSNLVELADETYSPTDLMYGLFCKWEPAPPLQNRPSGKDLINLRKQVLARYVEEFSGLSLDMAPDKPKHGSYMTVSRIGNLVLKIGKRKQLYDFDHKITSLIEVVGEPFFEQILGASYHKSCIVAEFAGSETLGSLQNRYLKVPVSQSEQCMQTIYRAISLGLAGDLSADNITYDGSQFTIIDLAQGRPAENDSILHDIKVALGKITYTGW